MAFEYYWIESVVHIEEKKNIPLTRIDPLILFVLHVYDIQRSEKIGKILLLTKKLPRELFIKLLKVF
jgi:hypothetical protein